MWRHWGWPCTPALIFPQTIMAERSSANTEAGIERRSTATSLSSCPSAANERTFLAWIRTGLPFGFFLVKLNVLFDAIGDGSPPHLAAENAGAFAAAMPDREWWRSESPSSDEAAPALSARAARSIAMRL